MSVSKLQQKKKGMKITMIGWYYVQNNNILAWCQSAMY